MNVVLYVADSLRADHLSMYGYGRDTAPHLGALAADGVVFDRAFAQSTWTRPSAASILTGSYPAVHGAVTMRDTLHPAVPRLPELLAPLGVASAAFSAIPQVSTATGFAAGFDRFVDVHADPAVVARRRTTLAQDTPNGVVLPRAADLTPLVSAWAEASVPRAFFAFVWAIDTHVPYVLDRPGRFLAPAYRGGFDGTLGGFERGHGPADRDRMLDHYDSAIAALDDEVGALVADLKRRGVYDDTLFVFTADHGEVFDEHDRLEGGRALAALARAGRRLAALAGRARYRAGHVLTAPYDEVMRVPLVVKFPRGQFAGRRVQALVQLIDLVPTILEVLGAAAPPVSVQGRSVLPLLASAAARTNAHAFCEARWHPWSSTYTAVRSESHKYVAVTPPPATWASLRARPLYFLARHALARRERLYDLGAGERRDVAARTPGPLTELRAVLRTRRLEDAAVARRLATDVSGGDHDTEMGAVARSLRGLGYL
jgi:arylsulfatase A-like enzyme